VRNLEEVVNQKNSELKEKNVKILDLMQMLEDFKIEVYSRDKTVQILQQEVQKLTTALRESKQFEHKYTASLTMQEGLKQQNAKLKEQVQKLLEAEAAKGLPSSSEIDSKA